MFSNGIWPNKALLYDVVGCCTWKILFCSYLLSVFVYVYGQWYVQIRPRDLIVRWPETDSHIADLNFVYCLHFMWSLHISVTVNSFLFNQYQWRYLVQQDYHIGMAELCVMQ